MIPSGLGMPVFTLMIVKSVHGILSKGPLLYLDADGITDNTGMPGVGRIRWDEMSEIRLCSVIGFRMIAIRLHDLRPMLARSGVWARLNMIGNQKTMGAPIYIAQMMLPVTADEVARIMATRFGVAVTGIKLDKIDTGEKTQS